MYFTKNIIIWKKNGFLKIIKYNKNIQNKLNISINDYKEYNHIEIEIIPINNSFGKYYGKFI